MYFFFSLSLSLSEPLVIWLHLTYQTFHRPDIFSLISIASRCPRTVVSRMSVSHHFSQTVDTKWKSQVYPPSGYREVLWRCRSYEKEQNPILTTPKEEKYYWGRGHISQQSKKTQMKRDEIIKVLELNTVKICRGEVDICCILVIYYLSRTLRSKILWTHFYSKSSTTKDCIVH